MEDGWPKIRDSARSMQPQFWPSSVEFPSIGFVQIGHLAPSSQIAFDTCVPHTSAHTEASFPQAPLPAFSDLVDLATYPFPTSFAPFPWLIRPAIISSVLNCCAGQI